MSKPITQEEKRRANLFLRELHILFDKFQMEIDCHQDFVSLLRDKKTNKILCTLYERCSPEFEDE